jgi:hypothetical protein
MLRLWQRLVPAVESKVPRSGPAAGRLIRADYQRCYCPVIAVTDGR